MTWYMLNTNCNVPKGALYNFKSTKKTIIYGRKMFSSQLLSQEVVIFTFLVFDSWRKSETVRRVMCFAHFVLLISLALLKTRVYL